MKMKKVVMEVNTLNKPREDNSIWKVGKGIANASVQDIIAFLEDMLTESKVSNWKIFNDHGILYVHGEFTRKALIEITGSLCINRICHHFKVVDRF